MQLRNYNYSKKEFFAKIGTNQKRCLPVIPIIVECAEGEIFESKNNSKSEKIYLGLYLNIGDKNILGTFCQNRHQKGPLLFVFENGAPSSRRLYEEELCYI